MGMSDTLFDIEVTKEKLTTKHGNDYYRLSFFKEPPKDKRNGMTSILIFMNEDSVSVLPQMFFRFNPIMKGSKKNNEKRDLTKTYTAYRRGLTKLKLKRDKKGKLQFYKMIYKRKKRYPLTFNVSKFVGTGSDMCPYATINDYALGLVNELFYYNLNHDSAGRNLAYKLLVKYIINIVSKKFDVVDNKFV